MRRVLIAALFGLGVLGCHEAQNRPVVGRPTFYRPRPASAAVVSSSAPAAEVGWRRPARADAKLARDERDLEPAEQEAERKHPPRGAYREF